MSPWRAIAVPVAVGDQHIEVLAARELPGVLVRSVRVLRIRRCLQCAFVEVAGDRVTTRWRTAAGGAMSQFMNWLRQRVSGAHWAHGGVRQLESQLVVISGP